MNPALRELSRIALIYRRLGKFNLANNVYQNIISRLQPKGDSVDLAIAFYDLAECYAERGLYAKAQSIYREAAHIYGNVAPAESVGFFRYSDAIQKLSELSEKNKQAWQHTSDADVA